METVSTIKTLKNQVGVAAISVVDDGTSQLVNSDGYLDSPMDVIDFATTISFITFAS